MAARAYALVAMAVIAAATAIGAVGERQSQTVALPLQGAADGLVMSHQPAAPLSYTGDARMEKRCLGSLINSTSSGSTPDCATNLTPWQLFEEFEQFDYDLAYHPGETIEPTPSPVQAATVRAAAYGGSLTEAEMIAVLREAGAPEGWIPPLLTIAFCESRWSPYAVGDGGNSLGMFQLWYGWARPMGYTPDDLFDPVKAARTAIYVREVRGRFGGGGGWTCADLSGVH